jgi:hypothetical protein
MLGYIPDNPNCGLNERGTQTYVYPMRHFANRHLKITKLNLEENENRDKPGNTAFRRRQIPLD